MSSHHVVKERQEPGLLILSLEGFEPEYLGQLLEWSPTVVVTDEVYSQLETMGLKIDGVITAFPEHSRQHHTRQIPMLENYRESGINYFIEDKYPAVNVIDREFKPENYQKFCGSINLVIYAGSMKIFPVKSGFSKWKTMGEKVILIEPVDNLYFTNLAQTAGNEFRVEKDGFYSLNFDQSYIFVAENY